jgi:hypothetical protein
MVAHKQMIPLKQGLRLDAFETMLNLSHTQGDNPTQIQDWTTRQFASRFDSYMTDYGRKAEDLALAVDKKELRLDSVRKDAATDGFHLARQLEYIHSQVMETPRPKFDGLELFPVSNEVPVGARTHTVRRIERQGDAKVYRAGMEIPVVGLSQTEEEFKVHHLVSGYRYDIFDLKSSDYARTGVIQRMARECRDEITALWDELTWFGDDSIDLYGVLNYPWLQKRVSAQVFSSATDADVMLAELHSLANNPAEVSKRVFSPNRMVVSTEIHHIISQKRIGDNADKTVLQFFLETSPYIQSVEASHRLTGVGPGGTDGILVYRDDTMGIRNELVQGVTPLPLQEKGIEFFVYMYASIGGVVMGDIGNNALMWVERA